MQRPEIRINIAVRNLKFKGEGAHTQTGISGTHLNIFVQKCFLDLLHMSGEARIVVK